MTEETPETCPVCDAVALIDRFSVTVYAVMTFILGTGIGYLIGSLR